MTQIAASRLLTREQLTNVRQRSNWRGVWLVVHVWGTIFGAMAFFALFPNPVTFILAVMLIGCRQLGIAIIMHDGAHGNLVRNPKLNMILSDWFGAFPIGADTTTYRHYHLKHHWNTQQEEDPDLVLSAPFPITRKSFLRKMIRDLTGQTGYQQRKAQILNAMGPADQPLTTRLGNLWLKLHNPFLCQIALFAGLALAGYWHLYFLLWLLPLLTWNMAVTRIRNIGEHAMVPDNDDPFRNARTVRANWLERMFIAPYWVYYHVEHHLMMWIPCYNLAKAHRYLLANGHGKKMEIKDSYADVLRMATSRPDADDEPGNIIHNSRRARLKGSFTDGFLESGEQANNRP